MIDNLPIFKEVTLSSASVLSTEARPFSMVLSAANSEPIGDLELKLELKGRPPNDTLVLRSTSESQLFYDLELELSAYTPIVEWKLPLVAGYTAELFVRCGDAQSNSITAFKK